MQQFAGKTAFITGGASGIGFALAHVFAKEGMQVMLADIESAALSAAVNSLKELSSMVRGIECDVADPMSVRRAADETFNAFGNVHIICNNAGVGGGTGIDDISLDNWRWVLDVNLFGVLHGVGAFLPHMRAHGEESHIVNTASMAGLQSKGGFSAYAASKYAVVSMSEGLAIDLKDTNIGVSVLCPSFVNTRIGDSQRNRQQQYGAAEAFVPGTKREARMQWLRDMLRKGRDPQYIAERTLHAIRERELYILTHPEWNWEVEERIAAIKRAMDQSSTIDGEA